MRQKIISLVSSDLENGSGMNRKCFGIDSFSPRKLFTILFVLLLGVGQVWGASVTFTSSSDYSDFSVGSLTKGGVTLSGAGSVQSSDIRFYKNSTVTVQCATNITALSFTFTTGSYNGGWNGSTASYSESNLSTTEWTKKTTSGSSGKQARITELVVTYLGKVTFDANEGSCSTTNLTQTTATANITLPTPTRDGFICTGWYTAKTGGTKRGDAGGTYAPATSETIYAQWEASTSCTSEITITKGSPSNGTFEMTGAGTTCIDEGNASVTISNIQPSNGYRFEQITSSGGGTIDNNAKTVSNISANTTINVVFEAIPTHKAYFYNGTTLLNTGGTSFAEGAAVSYGGSAPESCDTGEGASTTFAGWATGTWSGKVAKNAIVPNFYESTLPVMGNGDVNYYAVFCEGGSSSITITNADFTGSSLSGSYSTQTITKTIGTTDYEFEVAACIQSSMCQMRDNATLSYIAIPTLPGVITGISTTECANGSGSSYSGTLRFKSSKTRGNSDTDDIAAKTLSSATSFNWDLSSDNTTHTSGWLFTTAGLRLKDITITYGGEGTNYMTTCCSKLGSINGSVTMAPKSATLSWDLADAQNGGKAHINSWKVEYKKDGGNWTTSESTLAVETLTKTISGLDCNSDYDFRVSANVQSGYCDIVKEWTSQKTTQFTITKDETHGGGITLSPTATFVCDGDVIDVTANTPDGSHEGTGTIKVIKTGVLPEEDVTSTVYNQPSAGKLTMPAYNITISATYTEKQTPSVGASLAALDFGTPKLNESVAAKTFNLTGSALTAGTLTLVAPSGYIVSPSEVVIASAGNLSATEITVTPNTGTAGNFDGNIFISGAGVSSTNIVALTMTVQQTYTVNWWINGGKDPAATQTDIVGTTLSVPSDFSEFTDCSSFEFLGWKDGSAITGGSSTSAPSLANVGTEITAANKDYYAVFAEGTPGGYAKVTAENQLAANDKVVITYNDQKGMKAYDGSSTYYADADITFTEDKLTSIGDACEFTLGGTTDAWTFFDGTYYVYSAGSPKSKGYNNYMQGQTELTDAGRWIISIEDGITSITTDGNTDTPNMRYNTNSPRFSCYNSGQSAVDIYRKTAPVWTKYYTTCPGKVATPSITGVTGGQTYESDQTVTITSATAGSTIKYTTDGSDPASSATVATMATGSSFTLSTNGTYNIRAIAVKNDMTNSDEATPVSNVTIDKPFTSIKALIDANLAVNTSKKIAFTSESNAIITAVNSSNRYIQDASGYGIVIRSNSWNANAIQGKKITGTITGEWKVYEGQMQLDNSTFANMTFTAVDELPAATTVTAIDETNFASHPTALVKLESVMFASEAFSSRNVTINKGNASYTLRDGVYVFGHMDNSIYVQDYDLPLSTTTCDVTGLLIRYTKNDNTSYQLVPVKVEGISTKGALATLPELTGEEGGNSSGSATEVASGETIELTAATGFATTYKIGTGSENAVSTSGTEVTISGSNNDIVVITVKATREYYAQNSKEYYYKINNALTKYNITKSATNGTFTVKNSGGTAITSSVSGETITLAASAVDNYHFVSWAISNTSTSADVTSSVSLSSSTNKDATFVMPAYGVTISATFAEDPYATVTFVKGAEAAEGTAPGSQKVYVGQNATMPANTFTNSGYSFAGWELNSTTYQPGNAYPVTAAGTIEFAAKWREKDINKDGQWELVTNVNELNAGDYVVIAQNAQGKTESATIGGQSNKYLSGVTTTFSGENSEYITKENLNTTTAVKYVLGGTSGAWTLTDDATGKLLKIGSSDNPSWVDNNGSTWDIAIANNNASIYPDGSETKRILYNTSGGFRPYTTTPNQSMLLPQLYKFYRTAFILSYDANGGEGAPDSQRANPDNGQVAVSSTVPTREGYDFAGWEDGDGNAKSGTITLTANTTLYAQWTPTPYNAAVASVENIVITATPEGESAIAEGNNADVAYGTEVTLAYSELDNAYLFVEWTVTKADDAETVVSVNNNKFTMPAYAVSISANVQAKASVILNVTYAANGGEGTMEGNPFEFTYEQEVTVAANPFEKAQYTFMGWQDQDENVYKPGDKFNIVKNMTLTAIWRANGAMYTITSNTAVSSSASVPAGSTATYSQTYSGTNGQMIEGNSTTLTLTGYTNKIIKKAIFSMKTNKNGGEGSIQMTIGGRKVINYPSGDFGTWFGACQNTYKDIEVAIPDVLVNANEDIVVTMSASANSMYVASYTFEYANAEVYNSTTNIPAGEKEVIVVKDGGNVTFTGTVTAESLFVENGGKVALSSNKLTVVGTFAIETSMASGVSGQVTGASASNFEASEAYIDITLGDNANPEKWHAFTVPFKVDVLNGVFNATTGAKLANEVDYAIMEYHGDVRAQGKYGWKKIRTTLEPGTFYIITVNGDVKTFRFKKKAGEKLVAGNTKDLEEYPLNGGTDEHNDNGWNGVGNPTLRYGQVAYPVQVLNPTSYTYESFDANETNFVVGTPFFVQADAAAAVANMTFNPANGSANYAPARRGVREIEKMKVYFGNETFTDKLYISASEDALNEYQIGKDLAKMTMTSAPKVAQIFGEAYNTKLCMVHAPMVNGEARYALSLYAPAAGEYTISSDAMALAEDGSQLYLTYNGYPMWNLTSSPMTVTLPKGNSTQFGLKIVRSNAMPTGKDEVTGDGLQVNGVEKLIIDDHIYILRDGKLYDLNGKLVK